MADPKLTRNEAMDLRLLVNELCDAERERMLVIALPRHSPDGQAKEKAEASARVSAAHNRIDAWLVDRTDFLSDPLQEAEPAREVVPGHV